uniref:Uncharacterized protein n=1 Tax=Anopheles albimanus TaxID=7167 RepID=A0A182FYI6_ANOAL
MHPRKTVSINGLSGYLTLIETS